MFKAIENFFLNKVVFIISGVGSSILFIYNGFHYMYAHSGDYYLTGITQLFIGLLIAGLVIAYKKGEGSYQKTVIGAIFAALMVFQMEMFAYAKIKNTFSYQMQLVLLILTFLMLFNHLYLQVEHNGDEKYIVFNFIIINIVIIIRIYEYIHDIINGNVVNDYFWSPELLLCLIMILCIETRIQHYKKERFRHLQKGTWTKEEKEKQKNVFTI